MFRRFDDATEPMRRGNMHERIIGADARRNWEEPPRETLTGGQWQI
jgi:hypothetical protein